MRLESAWLPDTRRGRLAPSKQYTEPNSQTMPSSDYWNHISVVFLFFLSLTYITGLFVKYHGIKVNYTRKINHFALFFTSELLFHYLPYQRSEITSICGAILMMLFLGLFLKPIRGRSTIITTMFLSFDRPEDKPHTLLWLSTQFMGTYLVLIPISLYLAGIGASETLMIPILINGIGDGLAEPIGVRFGKHHYQTRAIFSKRRYTRSLEGSACVFVTSVLVILAAPEYFTDKQFIIALISIPPLMTLAEGLSPHTWDSPILYSVGGISIIGILEYC